MAFLHEHIILPLSDLLQGQQVYKYLRKIRKAEQWSEEQTHDFQQDHLRQLITYAAKEVPYYRDCFQANGFQPDEVNLNQLPIVNKSIMRQEGIDRFIAEHFPENRRIPSRSSGSTGEPFSFYESKLSYSVNMAAKLLTWFHAGYKLGDRYLKIVNGTRTSRIKAIQDRINNCLFIPFYAINDCDIEKILELIERKKPLFIRSYPIPLYLLAKYRNKHFGYHHNPYHIFTTGSTLSAEYRTEIERAFGCDIIDSYSCEGTPNTFETPKHDGYQISNYYGIIEILDNNDKPVTDGIGRVVSTDFWNYAHPFIRYDTQDLVEVKEGKITRIMGRECEALVHSSNEIYTVHNFSHFFLYEIGGTVEAYQLVKHRDGSITFRLVVNAQYNENIEKYITDYWQKLLECNVAVELVDEIPLMHNNKRLTIIEE